MLTAELQLPTSSKKKMIALGATAVCVALGDKQLTKGENKMANVTEIWVDADAVDFEFEGRGYSVSGIVNHQCHKESCGIGSYEYQGAKESDDSYEYVSEFKEATYEEVILADDGGNEIPRIGELFEKAKEAMWEATKENAQHQAWDV